MTGIVPSHQLLTFGDIPRLVHSLLLGHSLSIPGPILPSRLGYSLAVLGIVPSFRLGDSLRMSEPVPSSAGSF